MAHGQITSIGYLEPLEAENEVLRARVAELEAEVSRLKTVPMKYRRMQFNAELQEQVAKLEARLAERDAEILRLRGEVFNRNAGMLEAQKMLLLAKDALNSYTDSVLTNVYEHGYQDIDNGEVARAALAAIDDSKLLKGLILCDGNTTYLAVVTTSKGVRVIKTHAPRRTE